MSKKNYMQAQSEILDRANIVDIISEKVTLRKNGANYKGLCPFHEEKTPSFIVSPSKEIFKCFGCGKAGNVITFYKEHERLEWNEAIEELAKVYHIELMSGRDPDKEQLLQKHRNMLIVTKNFYHKNVDKIRDYIHSRLITDESIELYELGYAEGGYSQDRPSLIRHLYNQGFTIEDMLSQGIIKSRVDGSKNLSDYYETFWGRWIFPIHDERSKMVGFSGRVLPPFDKDKKYAKYINSPNSDLYNKSAILYALDIIKDKLLKSGQLHLVEGYTDAIVMNQEGILASATCGTSFTAIHAKKLLRFAKDILVVRDNDTKSVDDIANMEEISDISLVNSGLNAAKKDFEVLLSYGMSTRAIVLPPGEDPASFFIKYNKKDFEKLEKLNLAQLYLTTSDLSDSNKKFDVLEKIVQELSYIDDPLKKYLWIKDVGKLLDIPDIFIAKKYTTKLREEIKDNNAIDYFSKAYVNDLASKFVAKILLTTPKFAMPYLRDVPLSDIPNDGTIFSNRMLELYTTLNEQFSAGDYQLSMFGMDTSVSFGEGIDPGPWGLMDDGRQNDFRTRHLHYSIDNPELYTALREVSRIPRLPRRSRRSRISKDSTVSSESKPAENQYDLDTLARLLRSEIFLRKQNILMSRVSEELLSGSSGSDISNLVDDVERLHHRV